MSGFRSSSHSGTHERFEGKHRFEHWYRDNSVYLVTSRVSDGSHAFSNARAAELFWDRLEHWTCAVGFELWITSLMSNHYHFIGYLRRGENLGPMMQRFHGSVAKLVNDQLPSRLKPFWRTRSHRDYFDGCLRDELQLDRAYRYVQLQAVRAKLVKKWEEYSNTRVVISRDEAMRQAVERNALMRGVGYPRYDQRRRSR